MKAKYTIFFILLLSLVSCKKTYELDGGPEFSEFYIYENGTLIDAQNYTKTIPASGGMFDLEIISFGINFIDIIKRAGGIVLTTNIDKTKPDEKDFYDTISIDNWKLNRYKQTVTITAEPNQSSENEREAIYRIRTSEHMNGHATKIIIKQPHR